MKKSKFKDLYNKDYNLYHLFAMNQRWNDGDKFCTPDTGRKTSGLLFLKECDIKCIMAGGNDLFAKKGSVIYLPQNGRYTIFFYNKDKEKAEAQLIEFELRDKSGQKFSVADNVEIITEDGERLCAEFFDKAISTFEEPVFCCSEFKSAVYSLITEITRESRNLNMHSREFYRIVPVITFLEKNPMQGVSVSELAKMCHISEVCFRTIFKKYYGMTPSEYSVEQKISRAKKLLRSNIYYISEVAQMTGFEDNAYFSKVFKKKTGMLPREYVKKRN